MEFQETLTLLKLKQYKINIKTSPCKQLLFQSLTRAFSFDF